MIANRYSYKRNFIIMPRKARIESSVELCHIINRGNYRGDIFETDASKASFEKTIFETCEKTGWRVYAYVTIKKGKKRNMLKQLRNIQQLSA